MSTVTDSPLPHSSITLISGVFTSSMKGSCFISELKKCHPCAVTHKCDSEQEKGINTVNNLSSK